MGINNEEITWVGSDQWVESKVELGRQSFARTVTCFMLGSLMVLHLVLRTPQTVGTAAAAQGINTKHHNPLAILSH